MVNLFGIDIPESVSAFILWIAQPAFAAFVVAVLIEKLAWFQRLKPAEKWAGVALLFIGLPFLSDLLAYLISIASPEVVAALNHIYSRVLYGLTGLAASQVIHKWVNKEPEIIEVEALEPVESE